MATFQQLNHKAGQLASKREKLEAQLATVKADQASVKQQLAAIKGAAKGNGSSKPAKVRAGKSSGEDE